MIISDTVDHIFHALVAGLVVVLQLIIMNDEDLPLHTPYNFASLSLGAAGILSLYHLAMATVAMRGGKTESSEGPETEFGKALRNLLTALAIIGQFAALGHKREANDAENITDEIIIIVALSAMRLLDSAMDFASPGEALSVQCIEDKGYSPTVYATGVTLLLGGAAGLQILKRMELDDDGSHLHDSVGQVDFIALLLVIIHAGLHPLVKFLDMTPLKPVLVRVANSISILKNNSQCAESENELVAINRVPLFRQAIAGSIIAIQAFVLGALYGKNEINYQAAGLVVYLIADAVGRNVL